MDEREANIDLLFRNGLKDYEVLPPAEVWDKISPEVRKQNRAYIILRAAAMVAVLITLGFLTSTWNNKVSDNILKPSGPILQENKPAQSDISNPVLIADAAINQISSSLSSNKPVSLAPDKTPERNKLNNSPVSISRNQEAREMSQEFSEESASQNKRSGLKSLNGGSVSNDILADDFQEPYMKEIPVSDKKKRWSIAALVSPTYLSNVQTGTNEAVQELGSIEHPLISYAGGVALAYKVNKRLSVQSGLYYSSYGNELKGITSFGGFQNYDQMKGNSNFEVQTTNGTVYTDNSDVYLIDVKSDNRLISFIDNNSFDPTKASLEYLNSSLRQNLSYLELPVIIKYKFVDRAVDFNLIGGMSSNLLVNNSVYTTQNGGKYEVGRTSGLNTFTFSSSLGMGMEYSLGRNLSLNFEPTFRYYINPFHSMEALGVHPYSFGVFSGISYKF